MDTVSRQSSEFGNLLHGLSLNHSGANHGYPGPNTKKSWKSPRMRFLCTKFAVGLLTPDPFANERRTMLGLAKAHVQEVCK